MSVQPLIGALMAETNVPHSGEELAPGVSQVRPLGFMPGEPSYFIRAEHVALRNSVTVEAAPFSGHLLASVVERLAQQPEISVRLEEDIEALGWRLRKMPVAGRPILFEAREANAIVGEPEEARQALLADVCVRLSRLMLSFVAISKVPAHTRAAKRRDETTAENLSWEYDPAERDRSTATHRRLENWLIGRLEQEGIRPLDPDGEVAFDLAWVERNGSLSVCEVKSTSGHEDAQIRMGLGQVLHYAARLRRDWQNAINPVLLIETSPVDTIWLPLADEHGVVVAWPDSWEGIRSAVPETEPDTESAG